MQEVSLYDDGMSHNGYLATISGSARLPVFSWQSLALGVTPGYFLITIGEAKAQQVLPGPTTTAASKPCQYEK